MPNEEAEAREAMTADNRHPSSQDKYDKYSSAIEESPEGYFSIETSVGKVIVKSDERRRYFIECGEYRSEKSPTVSDLFPPKIAEELLKSKNVEPTLEEKEHLTRDILQLMQVCVGKKPQSSKPSALEVGETFTYTGDCPFDGRIQVTALGSPQSRYMKVSFLCTGRRDDCATCVLQTKQYLSFEDYNPIDPSAFASYFDTNNALDALAILVERGRVAPDCAGWRRFGQVEGEDERAVTQATVTDRQGSDGRAWFVHGPKCDLKRGPNWIVAEGWLCKGDKGHIGVLVKSFTPESEVIKPSKEELEQAKAVLRAVPKGEGIRESAVWKIAEALRNKDQLKGSDAMKGYSADLLTIGSPTWVKTPEGAAELGATTEEMGPTTTGKSKRILGEIAWLGAGKYGRGRQTEAGITAGAEKIEGIGWTARKGLLPSMDLSFLVLDNMWPHALDSQIESRRDGVVVLATIKGAEMWARCRLKLLSNPVVPLEEKMFKCAALRAYDSKLVARFTFVIFTYGASTKERYDPTIKKSSKENEELLAAARIVLRANLSVETTFTVPESLWKKIMVYGQELEEKYGNEDIPLLLRSTPYKLSVLTYAFALLEGEDEPTETHVTSAYEWLVMCADNVELGEYTTQWRKQHDLSDEDYAILRTSIEGIINDETEFSGGSQEETITYRFIEYIAKNERGQADEIAAYADNIDAKTIKRRASILKGLLILKSGREGYNFTARGVQFFKKWFHERVPVVPQVPVPRGETPKKVLKKEELKKVLRDVTPKIEDNRDKGDRLGPTTLEEHLTCKYCGKPVPDEKHATLIPETKEWVHNSCYLTHQRVEESSKEYICKVCKEPAYAPDLLLFIDENSVIHAYHKACHIKMREEEKCDG